jgi:Tat protein translocase TatB subunit
MELGARGKEPGDKMPLKHMFGTLGGPELFLIFVVALIIFGPRKLPEIGKSLGKMMGEFRRASNEFRSTIENEVEAEKIRESLRIEPPKVEPAAPAVAEPSVSDYPGSPDVTPATEPPPPTEPAVTAEPVPETVSRQPDNTPIEPQ